MEEESAPPDAASVEGEAKASARRLRERESKREVVGEIERREKMLFINKQN